MTELNLPSRDFSAAYSATDQPNSAMSAFTTFCAARFGLKLLTVFSWNSGDDLCTRVWSNAPQAYPFPASKKMGPTRWGDTVLRGRQAWCGPTRHEIRTTFFDHELIESLGCQSCISAPVVWQGRTIGAVSVLDAEGAYGQTDAEELGQTTWVLIPALLGHRLETVGSVK